MSTPFNPEDKDMLSYGESLGPAMKITDPKDAKQYLAAYVAHIQRALDKEPRGDDMTAAQIAGANLGYYAGYYDSKTRERVERLFFCQHPIFGKASDGIPTAEQAFYAGLAKSTRKSA